MRDHSSAGSEDDLGGAPHSMATTENTHTQLQASVSIGHRETTDLSSYYISYAASINLTPIPLHNII